MRRLLVGAGAAAGLFAASESGGLPTRVGLVVAVMVVLIFAAAKVPDRD